MTGAPVRVVLASKSPARLKILENAGIKPAVRVSAVDEDAVVASLPRGSAPAEMVCALAEAKALDVAGRLVHDLESGQAEPPDGESRFAVIGCDSMLEIGGRMVGKPGDPAVAVERIKEMRGKDATLWTGHSIALVDRDGEGRWVASESATEPASTIVHFGQISDKEIDAYVATGEPLNVAGSFTIDGLGGPFIEGVTGDPHSVVGLSLPLMRKLVSRFEIEWPELWNAPLLGDEN